MTITSSHLPTFCRTLEAAVADNKNWVCYDNNIQLLSVYDLEFFDSPGKAADFQLFNERNGKEVALLPTDALLEYLRDAHARQLRGGLPFSNISFDDLEVLTRQYEFRFNLTSSDLEALMDSFDWKEVLYDPLEANTEAETPEDREAFNQLESLMEDLSRMSVNGRRERDFVSALVERYWKGQPMEVYMSEVATGRFHTQQINHQHKTETMTKENQEYLQKQLKYADFGEHLYGPLERAMQEGKDSFQLHDVRQYGKDQMEAVLYFARSKQEGSDMYFFNRYDAKLTAQNLHVNHTFFINNKGQSIGLNEACNLMNGRSVFKEVTPKLGDSYKAWVKLNFSERDEHGNAKILYYNQNYGFDLKEAVGRLKLKEFSNPEQMENLYASLQKGNLTEATLLKGGKEVAVLLETDPKFKTMKMFDTHGAKLYVPGPQQQTQYGNAPVDEKRKANDNILQVGDLLKNDVQAQDKQVALGNGQENGQYADGQSAQNNAKTETVTDKKKDLLAKQTPDNNLMPKKRVANKQGRTIS